jgi:ACR3 family arsenite transporter
MVLGVGLGNAVPQDRLDAVFNAQAGGSASWQGVSIRTSSDICYESRLTKRVMCTALLIGLLVMIWPAMSKVQWEKMPILFRSRAVYVHLAISFVLNWILAPLVMALCAWIALPEASMDRERRGVLLVGVGA